MVDKLIMSTIINKNILKKMWIIYLLTCPTIGIKITFFINKYLNISIVFQITRLVYIIDFFYSAKISIYVWITELFYYLLIKINFSTRYLNKTIKEVL